MKMLCSGLNKFGSGFFPTMSGSDPVKFRTGLQPCVAKFGFQIWIQIIFRFGSNYREEKNVYTTDHK